MLKTGDRIRWKGAVYTVRGASFAGSKLLVQTSEGKSLQINTAAGRGRKGLMECPVCGSELARDGTCDACGYVPERARSKDLMPKTKIPPVRWKPGVGAECKEFRAYRDTGGDWWFEDRETGEKEGPFDKEHEAKTRAATWNRLRGEQAAQHGRTQAQAQRAAGNSGAGSTCQPGQTAATTGCSPAGKVLTGAKSIRVRHRSRVINGQKSDGGDYSPPSQTIPTKPYQTRTHLTAPNPTLPHGGLGGGSGVNLGEKSLKASGKSIRVRHRNRIVKNIADVRLKFDVAHLPHARQQEFVKDMHKAGFGLPREGRYRQIESGELERPIKTATFGFDLEPGGGSVTEAIHEATGLAGRHGARLATEVRRK